MKKRQSIWHFLLVFIFIPLVSTGEMHGQNIENPLLASSELERKGSVISLEQLLDDIEGDYNVTFLYEDKVIADKYVDAEQLFFSENSTGNDLANILTTLNINYWQLDEETYVLVEKKQPLISRSLLQDETITGTVTDVQSGETLPGVNVMVKGTTTGTSTDSEGQYEVDVPTLQDTLVVSFVGYQTQEIPINERREIDVALQSQAISGEEMVVVGYGTQSTRQLSSSVSNISSDDLEDQPVGQLAQKMQGKISGAQISQTTGIPGQGMDIRIRGSASLTAGNDPLYVVDGNPIVGDISNINPNEIESISVLKDASASALYGSRASNGVVLIETKSAVPGEVRVDYNAYAGLQQVPKRGRPDMMNAQEFATFKKEIAEFRGQSVDPVYQNPSEYGEGTDWYDAITEIAPIHDHTVTLSTGTETFSTTASVGYHKQDGVIVGSGYERYSLRINTDFEPHEKLNIGLNIAPVRSKKYK